MATLFTTAFTGADVNPLADGWTQQPGGFGPLRRVSNQADGTVDSGNSASYISDVSVPNDQWAECAIVVPQASLTGGGPTIRMSESENSFYGIQVFGVGPVTAALYYFQAGSYHSLLTTAISYTNGDVFKITSVGTTLKGYQNGTEILSTTDSTFSSGRIGIYAYNTSTGSKFDNFSGGSMGAIITGDLAVTDAPDTFAATGSVIPASGHVVVTIAVTDTPDIVLIRGRGVVRQPPMIVRGSSMLWGQQVAIVDAASAMDSVDPAATIEQAREKRQPVIYPFNRNGRKGFVAPLDPYA